ncbi:MAG: polyprenyl synthetase family protein [Sporolactobacillus sp.]
MAIAQIYSRQKKNLSRIEEQLKMSVASEHRYIEQAALDLIDAGGKRIRPLLTLLAARFGDPQRTEVLDAAVALELIHMASLIHDDVVDNSDLRRGKPTVKARWDNRFAMFTGDFIFSRAIERISHFQSVPAHRQISKVICELSLGEIDQIRALFQPDQNLRCYLRRIKRKTALLMALSCQLGALAAGCDERLARRLYYFGYFLGMSYQITDDVLDMTGNAKQLGKPAGSDLRNGNLTLPTLFAIYDNEELCNRVSKALADVKHADWPAVITGIVESNALCRAQRLSDLYLRKAEAMLAQLPSDNHATRELREIANYIGRRKK